jgi:hypothetical protein
MTAPSAFRGRSIPIPSTSNPTSWTSDSGTGIWELGEFTTAGGKSLQITGGSLIIVETTSDTVLLGDTTLSGGVLSLLGSMSAVVMASLSISGGTLAADDLSVTNSKNVTGGELDALYMAIGSGLILNDPSETASVTISTSRAQKDSPSRFTAELSISAQRQSHFENLMSMEGP